MKADGRGTFLIEEAQFGERLVLGKVDGQTVAVDRPLNGPARHQLGPIGTLMVIMHDRLNELQKQIDEIKAAPDDSK